MLSTTIEDVDIISELPKVGLGRLAMIQGRFLGDLVAKSRGKSREPRTED